MNKVIYRQADSRWGSLPYPTKAYSFAGNGCGCCACTHNIIEIPKYAKYTPKDVRPYMVAQGFATRGHGTTWDGITKTLEHYGFKVATPNIGISMKGAWDLLNKKDAPKQGVLLFRGGTKGGVRWTSGGHYVAFLDYKVKNGKHYFYTKDSGGRHHDGLYCYETTMRGLLPKIWVVTAFPVGAKKSTKPSVKYQGAIPKPTLKRGSKGDGVKALQRFLNWYNPTLALVVDGNFGSKTESSLESFQGTEGLGVDGIYGKKSYARAKTYEYVKPTTKTTTKAKATTQPKKQPTTQNATTNVTSTKTETYTGKLPTHNTNAKIINGLAYRLCYPYGTPKKKYTYKDGKPREAYKNAINEVFPKHGEWSNKKQKVGACCDVLTAVELGLVNIKVKKDLKDQLVDMPKMTKQLKSTGVCKASDFKAGMIVQRGRKDKSGHTYTICELVNGERYIANAHYKHLGGTYAVMDSVVKTENPKKWAYYKCYTVLGAIRTTYHKGDYGYDVLYIQKFLNWAGFKCDADGDFGDKTKAALESFQKKVGLKVDGIWGDKTQEKAKAYKRVHL